MYIYRRSLLIIFFFFTIALPALAVKYYVDPEIGNDNNPGTSINKPLKTLKKVSSLKLKPGDEVLLAAGSTFKGSLILKAVKGTASQPVIISSYSTALNIEDKRAIIDAEGQLNGILLMDCDNVEVRDIIITANGGGTTEAENKEGNMRCGVLVLTSQKGEYSVSLKRLFIHDVFYESQGFERGEEEVRTANGSQRYGWGIRFINRTEGAILHKLEVSDCVVKNVAHTGIKFTSRHGGIRDINVYNNKVLETGGPGIQMSGVSKGEVANNLVNYSGSSDDSRKWGRGSGFWCWGSSDILIEKNYFMNANGPGDSAGCHIDFNCSNVVVQYNFSANNAGGFCEILGNNYNCSYRYNISVNDGHRVKGINGAFQEGKTLWLSGYQGNQRPRKGPFNSYIYNNTIYVDKDIISKMAITTSAKGVLIANNIFHIKGKSEGVKGDQYVPEDKNSGKIPNVVFKNNLYLYEDNWPDAVLIKDNDPIVGSPQFINGQGLRISDYIPKNVDLIKNKGIYIKKIPHDSVGLTVGLRAAEDILGNDISGKPDLGAIELE